MEGELAGALDLLLQALQGCVIEPRQLEDDLIAPGGRDADLLEAEGVEAARDDGLDVLEDRPALARRDLVPVDPVDELGPPRSL
jgi:hypothetical protein